MQAIDRVNDVRDQRRERRLRSRNEELDQENRVMRTRMRALEDELGREREARAQALRTMRGMKPETITTRRRGGVLRLALVGGTAYVMGAKAGRERYQELRAWWDRLRSRGPAIGSDGAEVRSGTAGGSTSLDRGRPMSGSTPARRW